MSPADIMPGHEKAVLQGRRGDEHPSPWRQTCGRGIILTDMKKGWMGLTGRRGTEGGALSWFWVPFGFFGVFFCGVKAPRRPSVRHHYPNHQTILEAHQKSLHKVVTSAASV